MKNIILYIISAIFITSCSTDIKPDALDKNTDSRITLEKDTAAIDPLRDGEEIIKYDNGVIKMRGLYKNGKRDGVWFTWYMNGAQWSENFFENGLKNGRTVTYYENGKVRYEGFFKNDKKSGNWKFYSEEGKFIKEENY